MKIEKSPEGDRVQQIHTPETHKRQRLSSPKDGIDVGEPSIEQQRKTIEGLEKQLRELRQRNTPEDSALIRRLSEVILPRLYEKIFRAEMAKPKSKEIKKGTEDPRVAQLQGMKERLAHMKIWASYDRAPGEGVDIERLEAEIARLEAELSKPEIKTKNNNVIKFSGEKAQERKLLLVEKLIDYLERARQYLKEKSQGAKKTQDQINRALEVRYRIGIIKCLLDENIGVFDLNNLPKEFQEKMSINGPFEEQVGEIPVEKEILEKAFLIIKDYIETGGAHLVQPIRSNNRER